MWRLFFNKKMCEEILEGNLLWKNIKKQFAMDCFIKNNPSKKL